MGSVYRPLAKPSKASKFSADVLTLDRIFNSVVRPIRTADFEAVDWATGFANKHTW